MPVLQKLRLDWMHTSILSPSGLGLLSVSKLVSCVASKSQAWRMAHGSWRMAFHTGGNSVWKMEDGNCGR